MLQDPPSLSPPNGIDPGAWNSAITAIRGYCHWHIAPVAVETIVIVTSDGQLVAPTLRLVSVDDISCAGVVTDLSTVTTLGNVITRAYRFAGRATVTMSHGWPELPADLVEAAEALVAAQAAAAAAPGVTSIGSGPHTIGRSQSAQAGYAGIPPQIAATLDRYWIPSCPA